MKKNNNVMIPNIENIELMLMQHFNFKKNLIVFRVTEMSGIVNHECDCLVLSKDNGYLTEIEIKRSYNDFLADFKKKHSHQDDRIRSLFYCVHDSFLLQVLTYFLDNNIRPTAILSYNDECVITKEILEGDLLMYFKNDIDTNTNNTFCLASQSARPLFIEEKFQLARLGAMRYKTMTEKIIKLNK